MAKIYKRKQSKNYYYDFTTPDGKRHQGSTGTSNRADAQAIAERFEREAIQNFLNPTKPNIRLSEAWDLFRRSKKLAPKTVVNYERSLKSWSDHMGDSILGDLSAHTALEFISKRAKAGQGESFTRSTLIRIRGIVKHASEYGTWRVAELTRWIPETLEEGEPVHSFLTIEDINLIIANLKDHSNKDYLDYFLAYIYTGARHRELFRVKKKHYDASMNTLYIDGTKTKSSKRTVSVPPVLKEVLDRRIEGLEDEDFIFPDINHNLTVNINNRLGMEINHNDLRRTYCSLLLRGGASLFAVSKLMGHTSTKQIMKIYGQLYPDTAHEAALSMPAFAV